jgi:hypothetical protein
MKAEIRATTDFFGMKFWEVDAMENGKRIASVNIYLNDLRERKVTNTLSGKRKMLEWVNGTPEGQEYLKEKVEENAEKWRRLTEGHQPTELSQALAGSRKGSGGSHE